jgi:large conductance mechanosensitive channel
VAASQARWQPGSWSAGKRGRLRARPGIVMDHFKQLKSLEPAKKALSLAEEFKGFAFKGNVIDLAIGVIIGAAFGKIIESLVKNIIMPLVNLCIPGEQSYTTWSIPVDNKEIPFGLFLGDVVNFLIISAVLFLFTVKFLGWVMKAKKEEAADPPPLTKDQELLTEIRDLLRKVEGVPRENMASGQPTAPEAAG